MQWLAKYLATLTRHLVRLGANRSGNVAVVFAITLPILLGAAGLGVETSYWYYRSLQLQSAADAAAYTGGLEKLAGSQTSVIEAAAADTATSNGFETSSGTVTVHTPPTTGPNISAHAVEVVLRQTVERYFTSIFSSAPVVLSARAVAKSSTVSKACMLALDTVASKAALFSGSSNLTLTACAVMSNSTAADSIKVQGSAKLTVSCLMSAGGMDLAGGTVSTTCSTPISQTQPALDPFIDLPVPPVTNPCRSTKGATLQPGTYCSGLSLSGTVNLSAGVYVIDSGDLKINANANVTGANVTIYMRCGSRISINGTATVQLSAPTTGSYAGVLFYGDRTCVGGSNTFNGTATSLLTGAIYFAKQDVNYLGNFSGSGGCSQVVAGTIQWSGNTSIKQDCTSLGMRDIPANLTVQLVE